MIQKRSDRIGVEVVQPRRGDLAVLTLGREQQQQLDRDRRACGLAPR
ncbi:hypothetical protein NKH45_31355 [Mesorhizobium sp. M1156]